MGNGLKVYHPRNGKMSTLRGGRRTRPTQQRGNQQMANQACSPGRGGPRGGKDIIAVGTNQLPAALAGIGPWTFTFDIAEDCRLCKLIIQVTDPTGLVLDSCTQVVTALNHNNDRLISGLQVAGGLFTPHTQPGSNPVWGRYAVVSDQITINGTSSLAFAHAIACSISTM